MIEAVALGPDGAVFSVSRAKGVSRVLAHAPRAAAVLYETKEKLTSLWVSPTKTVYAGGKKLHFGGAKGAWQTAKLPHDAFSMWGASDDELFIGSDAGAVSRRAKGAWTSLGDLGDVVTCIAGTSARDVFFTGFFEGVRHYDGERMTTRFPIDQTQGMRLGASATWVCTCDALYVVEAGGAPREVASFDDEAYGVGVGTGGVFVLAPAEILRVSAGGAVEVARDNADKALMKKGGEYSTAITSDGTRVVVGGVDAVLVHDGRSFSVWPISKSG